MTDKGNQREDQAGAGPEESGGQPHPAVASLKRLAAVLGGTGIFHPDEWPVRKLLRRAMLLALAVFALAVVRHSIAHIRENQVGVAVHNLTGRMELRERVGYHLLLPYVTRMYVLDKTIQRSNLTLEPEATQGPRWMAAGAAGSGAGRHVNLKVADGSTVRMDLSISYKIMPEKAVTVLRHSGEDPERIRTLIESQARHVAFASFGRLTTEDMYDSALRSEAAGAALADLNRRLNPLGIEVIALIPIDFDFFAEYEQVIQEKKLADQQVEEQQSQAMMLLQERERQLVEARAAAESKIARVEGERINTLIQARADADRTNRTADGRYAGRRLEADGVLYKMEQDAQSRLALLTSEAASLEQRRRAMAGMGGLTMVGLEYARRLESVRFTGTPVTRDPSIQQFSVQPGEPAKPAVPSGALATASPGRSPQPGPSGQPGGPMGQPGGPMGGDLMGGMMGQPDFDFGQQAR